MGAINFPALGMEVKRLAGTATASSASGTGSPTSPNVLSTDVVVAIPADKAKKRKSVKRVSEHWRSEHPAR